jgi:hypothetical protein
MSFRARKSGPSPKMPLDRKPKRIAKPRWSTANIIQARTKNIQARRHMQPNAQVGCNHALVSILPGVARARYCERSVSTPPFNDATSLMSFVKFSLASLSRRNDVKCVMQSRVVAPSVVASQSITIWSVSGIGLPCASMARGAGLRFFGGRAASPVGTGAGNASPSSSALRLFDD